VLVVLVYTFLSLSLHIVVYEYPALRIDCARSHTSARKVAFFHLLAAFEYPVILQHYMSAPHERVNQLANHIHQSITNMSNGVSRSLSLNSQMHDAEPRLINRTSLVLVNLQEHHTWTHSAMYHSLLQMRGCRDNIGHSSSSY
jgi:hypothetical protein